MISVIFGVVGQLFDARTTQQVLNRGGKELNPVIRKIIEVAGMKGFYAVKIVLPLCFGLAYAPLGWLFGGLGIAAGCWNLRNK